MQLYEYAKNNQTFSTVNQLIILAPMANETTANSNVYTKGEYYAMGNNIYGQCAVNSNDESITQYTAIDYFFTLNIKIHKIFTNCNGISLFWLTNDGKIYGNRRNECYQLGLIGLSEKY